MSRPAPLPSRSPPLLALATLVVLVAIVNVTAGLVERSRSNGGSRNPEVHGFGAKEPGDVELFTKVVRRRQLPTKGRLDTARYPPAGGVSKNVVTHVEVSVPQRTLTKDEVRVTEGGPGMGFVVVTIGGRRSFLVDYTFTVYGREVGAAKLEKPTTDAAAGGSTEAAAAASDDAS